ncbi:hypothetical protein Pme01_08110 [Planosporangium mesophilum]|uniref:Uncharacterized protein n=1 Tax=Planosporangium mesophilum TaxID=689768 RepID=A0A8J3WZH1_9ACTN|nr:hypothetical protein Pme01_08110 [Planosporangium mesophilum]
MLGCIAQSDRAWVPALEISTALAAGPSRDSNACRASRSTIGDRQMLAWQTINIRNPSPVVTCCAPYSIRPGRRGGEGPGMGHHNVHLGQKGALPR